MHLLQDFVLPECKARSRTVRKLATAVAVSLALASSGVQALGLGDIEMHSALNQPLDAEIIINSVQPGELEGLLVQLASREAFLRAGIDRSNGLSDLKFSLDKKSDGTPFIKVGSKGPVVEPFLNFLLEVDWPKGRMVREYTILLDPPVFMNQEAVSSNGGTFAPEVGSQIQSETDLVVPVAIDRDGGELVDIADGNFPAEEVVIDSIVISSDTVNTVEEGGILISDEEIMMASAEELNDLSVVESPVVSDSEVPMVVVMGDETETETTFQPKSEEFNAEAVEVNSADYTVAKNDTLWEIAANNKPSNVSVQQMMLALLRTNEAAFSNGNVNRLKAGAILRMPSADEVSGLSRNAAVAQMVDQNRLWQEYRDNIGRTTTVAAQDPVPTVQSESPSTDISSAEQSEDLTPPADLQGEVAELVDGTTDVLEGAAETAEEVVADVTDSVEEVVVETSDELSIVADPSTTEGAATPTADEIDRPDGALIGQINSDLALSQEELETAQLEKEDLLKQESELESNSDKMERLIELRETELAQLQDRLSTEQEQSIAPTEGESNGAEETPAEETESAAEAEDAVVVKTVEPIVPVVVPEPTFIETLMSDPIKAAGVGLGALGILGGLAWFFTRGRRKEEDEVVFEADDEEFYEGDDDTDYAAVEEEPIAEFDDEKTVLVQQVDVEINEEISDLDDTDRDGLDDNDFLASAVDDESSKDDTISEADVYLAYGLHGQAEDLLTKAVDRDPENQEYHLKLMETHRSQNKVEEFNKTAENFHARFGGDTNPAWNQVAEMGRGLDPDNAMFKGESSSDSLLAGAAAAVVGVGAAGAAVLGGASEDLADSTISLNEFDGTGDVTEILAPLGEADFAPESEVALMDQSIDPGLAFDEADLEATGDFSAIAAEVSSEFQEVAEKTIDLDDEVNIGSALSSDLDGGLDFNTEDLLSGESVSEGLVAATDDLDLSGDLDLNADFDLDSLDANELAEKATEAEALLDSSLSEGLGELGEKADDLSSMMDDMDGTADVAAAASLGSASSLLEEVDLDSLNDTSFGSLDDEAASLEATTGLDIGDTGLDFEESVLDLSSMADSVSDKAANAGDSILDGLELAEGPEELTLDLDQLGGVEDLDDGVEGLFDHTETLDTAFDQTQELEIPDLTANADLTSHDDSSSFGSTNEMETMLDLAKAYIDMGDNESASSALNEIVKGGSKEQKDAAEQLLKKIG